MDQYTLISACCCNSIKSHCVTARGPYATAMGSNWHPDCFCCSSCCQPLSNVTFVIEGSDVYCEKCYKQGVAPICEACQQAITGVSMAVIMSHHFDPW